MTSDFPVYTAWMLLKLTFMVKVEWKSDGKPCHINIPFNFMYTSWLLSNMSPP